MENLKPKHIEKLLDFSKKIALKSEKITLKFYEKKIKYRLKKNLTPVTEADLKCEDFLIEKIKKNYPGHSIYSEERGIKDNKSEFRWFIDPIDGTKNYMRKYPFWGTLLGLEYNGEIILGVISMPALNEFIYAAKGLGCYMNGKRCKVSKIKSIEKSYCLFGGLEYLVKQPYFGNFTELVAKTNYSRGFGDCHGHSLVIIGGAEMMIDPNVAPYDIAPIKICVEEAGGILTDIKGEKTIFGGNAVVTNGRLHESVLEVLNGSQSS